DLDSSSLGGISTAWSPYVAQAGVKLVILLPQHPEFWDPRGFAAQDGSQQLCCDRLWAFPGPPPQIADAGTVASIVSQAVHHLCSPPRHATQRQSALCFTVIISIFGPLTQGNDEIDQLLAGNVLEASEFHKKHHVAVGCLSVCYEYMLFPLKLKKSLSPEGDPTAARVTEHASLQCPPDSSCFLAGLSGSNPFLLPAIPNGAPEKSPQSTEPLDPSLLFLAWHDRLHTSLSPEL
ncbi:hypothetical protein STEG23_021028, partial [Scotinomys teguina]